MKKKKPRFPGQVGETKVQVIEENFSNFGTYVWHKPSGKAFTDGDGNALSIESMKGDPSRIQELKNAAKYWGQAEGTAKFYPNMKKISQEEHSEQFDRMQQGLIPSMNDLGALIAAKKTLNQWGDEG
tara:strand:+ start:210 stop:590 length:381 start_codon:yes stop_codon:yes gene_type:complete